VDPVESKFETSTDLLNTMMRESGLPPSARVGYREYLREAKAYDTMVHFREVASQFSPQLKGELLLHVSRSWTSSVPYLKDASERILMELTEVTDLQFYARKEELQQVCNCLRLVERGTVASAGRILMRGDAFNTDFIVHNVLWRRFPRTMSLTYSMVMALERSQLMEVSERYPVFRMKIRTSAAKIAMIRCMGMCAQRSKQMAYQSEDGRTPPPLSCVFEGMLTETGIDDSMTPAGSKAARAARASVRKTLAEPMEPLLETADSEKRSTLPSQPPASGIPDTLRRTMALGEEVAPTAPTPVPSRLDALEAGLEATLNLVQRQLQEVRTLRQEARERPAYRSEETSID